MRKKERLGALGPNWRENFKVEAEMENIPNTITDLFIGYGVIWGILALYIVTLARERSRL